MPPKAVARVVIESSLPQLGAEFDYLVPAALQQDIEFGCRIAAPMGRGKQLVTGFVIELLAESKFARRELVQVLGPSMLTPELLECCRIAARRQVVSLGEFLRAAAPAFMPTQPIPDGHELLPLPMTFRTLSWNPPSDSLEGNCAMLSSPVANSIDGQLVFDWASLFLSAAIDQLNQAKSSILIVPEEADYEPLITAAELHGVTPALVTLQDKRKAGRYRDFWQARRGAARIYLGTRSAVLHPASNLGLIGVYDDLDESLRSKASPHIHARELALIRAQTSGARVLLAAPYRSLEVQRLVSIGFARDLPNPSRPPRVSHFDSHERLPSEFFSLVRAGIENGPVLVLVPSRSWSSTARCKQCEQPISCAVCGGPGYMPTASEVSCRFCNSNISSCVACGSRAMVPGRPGAGRVTADLGKSFAGTVVRDYSGDAPKGKVGKRDIVIATPSAAPRVPSGYAALAVLDCAAWLNRSSLRVEQFAIRDWQEAISLVSPAGRSALFGVPPEFGRTFAVQDFVAHAAHQLREMSELRFPPAWRVCHISGVPELVIEAAEQAVQSGAEIVSRNSAAEKGASAEVLLRFRYQDGFKVSDALKAVAIRSSLGGSAAGKRRLKIAMDELAEL